MSSAKAARNVAEDMLNRLMDAETLNEAKAFAKMAHVRRETSLDDLYKRHCRYICSGKVVDA